MNGWQRDPAHIERAGCSSNISIDQIVRLAARFGYDDADPHLDDIREASMMRNRRRREQTQILLLLLQDNEAHAASRSVRISRQAVERIFVDAATAFADLQDQAFRDLPCKTLRIERIRCLHSTTGRGLGVKQGGLAGDVWAWAAIDVHTGLVPCWRIGDGSAATEKALIKDLKIRLAGRARIIRSDRVARTRKNREVWTSSGGRNNSPAAGVGGSDPLARALSRRTRDHRHSLALYFMHHNFCRVQEALQVTPAMAAGVTGRLWDIDDLVQVVENWESIRQFSPGAD